MYEFREFGLTSSQKFICVPCFFFTETTPLFTSFIFFGLVLMLADSTELTEALWSWFDVMEDLRIDYVSCFLTTTQRVICACFFFFVTRFR